MDAEVTALPAMRLAYVRSDMSHPAEAWQRLMEAAGASGILARPGISTLAVFPVEVIQGQHSPDARYDAALVLPEGEPLPDGLDEARIPAGRYVTWPYTGPYEAMGDAWSAFTSWLAASEHRPGPGVCLEIYRNSPMDTAPEALRTDLCIPIA